MIWRGVNGKKRLRGKSKWMSGGKIAYTYICIFMLIGLYYKSITSKYLYWRILRVDVRKIYVVMMTQPSPRYLIGFGTEIAN